MSRIVLAIVAWAALIAPAHARHMKTVVPAASGAAAAQSDDAGDNLVRLNTRYGLVQYDRFRSTIKVDGTPVYDGDSLYVLADWGVFKLSDEDVILFEGSNTGSGGIPGQTFFLRLKPGKAPEVVQAPINSMENPIKKAWRAKDAIYADFEVGDYDEIKPPLTFASGRATVGKATPALYAKSGPRLRDDDCAELYDMSRHDCSRKSTGYHLDCSQSANAAGGVGMGGSEMRWFAWLSRLPGFNAPKFNQSCLAWCIGEKVSYGKFSKTVCNIK